VVCVVAFLAAGLRPPSIAFAMLEGGTSRAEASDTAATRSARGPAIEQQAEHGRVPVARPAAGPERRGTTRMRDASFRGLHVLAETARACGLPAGRVARSGSPCSVWSPGPPSRTELMVFRI
jgi:hypothetical protein